MIILIMKLKYLICKTSVLSNYCKDNINAHAKAIHIAKSLEKPNTQPKLVNKYVLSPLERTLGTTESQLTIKDSDFGLRPVRILNCYRQSLHPNIKVVGCFKMLQADYNGETPIL